ncbi:hypothetical protein FP803_05475 [Candidatus Woesearchaeota archaeon]|nr:hypothetical protein [Candidatus Woesearchaeota archaeon]MBU3941712.1 hypothetical protein [Nanoarchaeota archaeon]
MKSKKGQSLPMNTIVIAAIVLIVLVVIIMIFTGRMGGFTHSVQDCVEQGGECVAACNINEGILPIAGGECKTGTCCSKPIK